MGHIGYGTGIAILQFIIYPFIFAASLFVWKRTGWRVGAKIWRYPAVLSLLRIAGSIASFIAVDHNSENVVITIAVCQLIGIAPLVLTYVGILRQIDYNQKMPPRPLALVTLVALIALIMAIAGVSTAKVTTTYHPGTLSKVAMGLFIGVFVVVILLTVWLYTLNYGLLRYQKKLFLAIALSVPFLAVRIAYSALADYTTMEKFALFGNNTIYLCMCVLEEIVANVITLGLGISAVLEHDFVKLSPHKQKIPDHDEEHQDPEENKPLTAQGYNTAYNGAQAAYNPAYDSAQAHAQNTAYTPAYNPPYNPPAPNAAYAPPYHPPQN